MRQTALFSVNRRRDVDLSATLVAGAGRRHRGDVSMIQPELWVDRGALAVDFYGQAFGARVSHLVGKGDDIVAQLDVDGAIFWVVGVGDSTERMVPRHINGATARFLLVVEDPDAIHLQAVTAGAAAKSAVQEEHGWRVGRVIDPLGREWEIGRPAEA